MLAMQPVLLAAIRQRLAWEPGAYRRSRWPRPQRTRL